VKIPLPLTDRLPTVDEIAPGGVAPASGNAAQYVTGSWRTERPTYDPSKCSSCLICWISCPDGSIIVKDGKMVGIDAAHCKGCGICAAECPAKPEKAIAMLSGGEYVGNEMFDRR
jgi:pyruvate ferredoxin oxidoreductase delta subunit